MFLSIDGTLVVQVVNFVVFIVLLNLVFLKPVGAAIAKRRAYLDELAREVESGQAEVAAIRGRAEEARAAARREADAALAERRAASQREAEAALEEYRKRAEAIVAQAQAEVAKEIASARAQEDAIVAGIARDLVDRAVGTGAGA